MFDGFDPADLLGESGAAPAALELDKDDPINRGLMAFWPGGEAGGSLRDLTPSGLHAAPVAAPPRITTPRIGRAPNFNGSSHYFVTGNSSIPGSTAAHSVVAWVRPNFSSASNTIYNIVIRGAGSSSGQRLVWVNSTVGWYSDNVSSGSGAAFQTGAATPSFSAGEWHLLEFTYNSGGQFYWDGVLVSTTGPLFGTWPNANLAGTPFYIGRDITASQYWNGQLGPIREYIRPLTPGERRRILTNPWAGAVDPDARLYLARSVVTASTPHTATPGAGTITLAGQAGTVTAGATVAAGAGALTLQGFAATVTAGAVVSGGAGTLGLQGFAATLAAGATLAGGVGTLGLQGNAGTVTAGAAVAGGAGAIALQGFSATIAAGVVLQGGPGSILLQGHQGRTREPLGIAPAERTVTWPLVSRAATWVEEARSITWPDPGRSVTWRQ